MAKTAVQNLEDITINAISYSQEKILELIRLGIQTVADLYNVGKPGPAPTDGYFTLRSAVDGRVLLVIQIGDNPPDKCSLRCFNSQEKGQRLFERVGDLSSWQSRDPHHATVKKWGGAIIAGDYILSFSGLPEHGDETLMAYVAVRFGWVSISEALSILAISSNDIGQNFIDKMDLLH